MSDADDVATAVGGSRSRPLVDLRAAVDRVIPADDWPGGWAGGVGTYLAEGGVEQRWPRHRLERLVAELGRRHFADAEPDEQDHSLRHLRAAEPRC